MSLDPPADVLETCDGTEMVRVRKGNRWRWISTALFWKADRLDALERRVAALEGRPEEVVGFTGSAALGTVVIGAKILTLTGLAGLKAGERITVQSKAPLPAGLSIAAARVTLDGTVEITLTVTVAVTGNPTLTFLVTALR